MFTLLLLIMWLYVEVDNVASSYFGFFVSVASIVSWSHATFTGLFACLTV